MKLIKKAMMKITMMVSVMIITMMMFSCSDGGDEDHYLVQTETLTSYNNRTSLSVVTSFVQKVSR